MPVQHAGRAGRSKGSKVYQRQAPHRWTFNAEKFQMPVGLRGTGVLLSFAMNEIIILCEIKNCLNKLIKIIGTCVLLFT